MKEHIKNKIMADDGAMYSIIPGIICSVCPDFAPIREILTKCDYKDVKELDHNQLRISGF